MNTMTRRQALSTASAVLSLSPSFMVARAAETSHPAFAELEKRAGGRLGVVALDTATGALIGHRHNERFGMCSTFKLPLAALVLREIDQGRLRADQWLSYGKKDMVPHAPVTSQHLSQGGMTAEALAEAAQVTSDNVAANVLIKQLGGPAGITALMRSLGDTTTRLDRMEPMMNRVLPGEVHDTTTPAAMAQTMSSMLTTDRWLKPASRERLINWMVVTQTGNKRLRAGFPAHWRAGDKTGTAMSRGMKAKYNDLAIAWPGQGRAPLIIAAFHESKTHHDDMRDEEQAVLAEVGRITVAWLPA